MKRYKRIYYKVTKVRKNISDKSYIGKVYNKYKEYIEEGLEEIKADNPLSATAQMNSKEYFEHVVKLVGRNKPNKDFRTQVSMAVQKASSERLEEERREKTMHKAFNEQLRDEGIEVSRRNKITGRFQSAYNKDGEDWEFYDAEGRRFHVHRRSYPKPNGDWYEIEEIE